MAAPTKYENLSLERRGDIFLLTLQQTPENRLTTKFSQEIIRAMNDAQKALGQDSPGALIIRGNDAKFFCTVRSAAKIFKVKS
jgi:Delta3-Delta2-enoyl-CoA isomerase